MLVGQTKQAPVFIISRKVDVLHLTCVLTYHGFEIECIFCFILMEYWSQ
jgi:hypothetical protein